MCIRDRLIFLFCHLLSLISCIQLRIYKYALEENQITSYSLIYKNRNTHTHMASCETYMHYVSCEITSGITRNSLKIENYNYPNFENFIFSHRYECEKRYVGECRTCHWSSPQGIAKNDNCNMSKLTDMCESNTRPFYGQYRNY